MDYGANVLQRSAIESADYRTASLAQIERQWQASLAVDTPNVRFRPHARRQHDSRMFSGPATNRDCQTTGLQFPEPRADPGHATADPIMKPMPRAYARGGTERDALTCHKHFGAASATSFGWVDRLLACVVRGSRANGTSQVH